MLCTTVVCIRTYMYTLAIIVLLYGVPHPQNLPQPPPWIHPKSIDSDKNITVQHTETYTKHDKVTEHCNIVIRQFHKRMRSLPVLLGHVGPGDKLKLFPLVDNEHEFGRPRRLHRHLVGLPVLPQLLNN